MQEKEKVVRKAISEGLLSSATSSREELSSVLESKEEILSFVDEHRPCGFFYDLDAYKNNLRALKEGFPKNFFHACAIKNNPMTSFLGIQKGASERFGAECASFGEIVQALKVYEPSKIVFDSPCKSMAELKASVLLGVHTNLDNLQEVEYLKQIHVAVGAELFKNSPVIGIRVNPLVGWGKISELSVSTKKSKFGMLITPDSIEQIAKAEYITCVHVHTGSNGMDLDQLVLGVRGAVDFLLAVNKKRDELGISQRVSIVDIGGGLPRVYTGKFDEYAAALKEKVPELFDEAIVKKVVTEFGMVVNENFAFFASRIEYTKQNDENNVLMIHGGSDIFLRNCYCPGKFVNWSMKVLDSAGNPKSLDEELLYDIGGPLCFAGDVVKRDVKLAKAQPNDLLLIDQCGGNTISLKNMHCSRVVPPVYGYTTDETGNINITTLKKQQQLDAAVAVWD